MICPDCKSEMSKKWQPRGAGEVAVASGMVWSCGVCGSQLTLADMKSHVQAEHPEHKEEHEAVSNLLTLPRPVSALTPWAPTEAKRNRG
jgi:hypothetical protein